MNEHRRGRARGVAAVPSPRNGGPRVLTELTECAPVAPEPPVRPLEDLSDWRTLVGRQTRERHRPALGDDGSLRCPACLEVYQFAANTLGPPSLQKLPLG